MTSNLLATQTSPYLLQHQHNPVHWYPWGEQAFAAAKAANKPILLSVGYAACHWCHVMAHESFEDEDTARVMNELFVSIKVDREERPDVDTIYQTALAMMNQQGGWPLTMFLTPDGKPFWGGTYFPPEPRYDRPAFTDVLRGVAEAWTHKPDQVQSNVAGLGDALSRLSRTPDPDSVSAPVLDEAAQQVLSMVDPVHGGLRGAPKFPQPCLFGFLWRNALRTGDDELRQAVLLTLERMSQGGIYDHLGGGYARYATDAVWLAPHFEKMLYDNAQIVALLTEVWRDTKEPLFAQRVAETIAWLQREMIAEADTFAATLDADSEGEEGRFYVWDEAEIRRLLPPDKAAAFAQAYDVKQTGNWEGKTILNRSHATAGSQALEDILADCRGTLLRARAARVHPGRDDKVLTDWNGLMIGALAEAAFAFDRPDWLELARTAFDGVLTLMAEDDRLGHAYRLGRLQRAAMLDDYAAMARAAVVLFEVTGEPAYLDHARTWVRTADALYWDDTDGGYFFTPADATDLIVRTKTAHDTAVPSGNGMMAEVLVKLHHLTGDDSYGRRAERLLAVFSGLVRTQFPNLGTLLDAYALAWTPLQIVIVGATADPRTQALRRVVAETALPARILQQLKPAAAMPPNHPATGKGLADGAPAAYVCRGPTCSPPVTAPDALRAALSAR